MQTTLFEIPDLFQAHIAASPGLHWDGGSELDRARKALNSTPSLENFVASRGRSLIRRGDLAGAMGFFEYNAQIHPEAPHAR